MQSIINIIREGEHAYCTLIGDCIIRKVNKQKNLIKIESTNCTKVLKHLKLDEYGRVCEEGECVLFPNRDRKSWDLPLDTPVMVYTSKCTWELRYYYTKYDENSHYVFPLGLRYSGSLRSSLPLEIYSVIVPFSLFDPINVEQNKKNKL